MGFNCLITISNKNYLYLLFFYREISNYGGSCAKIIFNLFHIRYDLTTWDFYWFSLDIPSWWSSVYRLERLLKALQILYEDVLFFYSDLNFYHVFASYEASVKFFYLGANFCFWLNFISFFGIFQNFDELLTSKCLLQRSVQ